MSSDFGADAESIADAVSFFFQFVIEVGVFSFPLTPPPSLSRMRDTPQKVIADFLRRPEPFPLEITLVMKRIFLCDVNANYYYDHNGFTYYKTPEGDAASGDWGIIPPANASKYFVANINALGRSGCFESILARIQRTSPPIALEEVETLCNLVQQLRFCYRKEFILEYVCCWWIRGPSPSA